LCINASGNLFSTQVESISR